mmetsp:Transcript_6418/g.16112  ORF Transcript_6418/g.16112 Transcript_6418/m.16112 type:complete len:269 (-) Transcript_6418:1573-2379(-)
MASGAAPSPRASPSRVGLAGQAGASAGASAAHGADALCSPLSESSAAMSAKSGARGRKAVSWKSSGIANAATSARPCSWASSSSFSAALSELPLPMRYPTRPVSEKEDCDLLVSTIDGRGGGEVGCAASCVSADSSAGSNLSASSAAMMRTTSRHPSRSMCPCSRAIRKTTEVARLAVGCCRQAAAGVSTGASPPPAAPRAPPGAPLAVEGAALAGSSAVKEAERLMRPSSTGGLEPEAAQRAHTSNPSSASVAAAMVASWAGSNDAA